MSSITFDGTIDGHVAGTVCDGAVIVDTDTCGIFFSDVDDTIGNQVLDYTCRGSSPKQRSTASFAIDA